MGRIRERGELSSALEDAIAGRGRLVLVSGEPGIGKTHLIDRVSTSAAARAIPVLWGRCWEGGGAPAYWPWVQVLRAWVAACEPAALARQLGRGARYVAQLVPEIRDRVAGVPDLPPASALDTSDARFALFDAATAFVRAVASVQPLVIVLDDLHAADLPSLQLLHFLARDLRGAPLLVVGAHREAEVKRSSELGTIFGHLARESVGIALRGLGEAEAGELVRAITGQRVAPDVVGALHRVTAGNPLFLDELIRFLQAEDRLHDANDASGGGALPLRLRATIERRLEALGGGAVRVLQIAAVVGQEFDLGLVQRIAGLSGDDAAVALRAAVDEAIVAPLRPPASGFRFAHPLTREVLYDALSEVERARLHVRVGEAIEAEHAAHLDPHLPALAHHFHAAGEHGDPLRAIDYARRTAGRAMALLAWEDAVVHLERALALLERGGAACDAERCEVLLALGDASRRAGAAQRATRALEEAADLAHRLGAPVLLARAALGFAAPVASGQVHEGRVEIFEQAVADLPAEDGALRARLLARLAWELYWEPATEARRHTLCDEALGMARRLGDPATLAFVLNCRCFALWGPDDLADRVASSGEMLELAIRAGDLELEAHAHHWRVIALLELGDVAGVDRETAAVQRIVDRLPQPEYRWWLAVWTAMRALLEGRLIDAEGLIAEAMAVGELFARENATTAMQGQLFPLLLDRGRLDDLASSIEAWRAAEPYHSPALVCGLAMIFSQLGRKEEARREFEQLAATSFTSLPRYVGWLDGMLNLAQACAFLEDRERAARLYEMLLPYRSLNVVTGPALYCSGPVARSLALLAACMERWDDAELFFEDALARCNRIGAVTVRARTQCEYAAMLSARGRAGDRARALTLAQEALVGAREMGMDHLAASAADRCASLADAAGAAEAGEEIAGVRSVFRRAGDVWTIEYGGRSFHLRHHRGLRFIAKLLACPGVDVLASELVSDGEEPGADPASLHDLASRRASDAGEVLDAKARAEYRRRCRDLERDLAEAEANHDLGRAERLRNEIAFLHSELARAVGLGGRARRAGSSTERARINVSRAVAECLRRIGRHHPDLERHLGETLRTGTFCSYRPDSRLPIRWET